MEEKEQETGVKNPAHKLLGKLQENRKSLHIARVPDKTKKAFIALAEEDFCGDYGMTLKWLFDDVLSQDTQMAIAKLEDHEERIQRLESTKQPTGEESDKKFKRMLDGSKKGVRGLQENE